MVVSKFWSERFEQAHSKYAIGLKSVSTWKLMNLLLLKYNFDLSARGISAMEVGLRLIKNKEMWDKLEQKDKEFVEGLFM